MSRDPGKTFGRLMRAAKGRAMVRDRQSGETVPFDAPGVVPDLKGDFPLPTGADRCWLAHSLLSMRDNDHVELHEGRGFVGEDLLSAFRDVGAVAEDTRCENYLLPAARDPFGGAPSNDG